MSNLQVDMPQPSQDQFLEKAKRLAVESYNKRIEGQPQADEVRISIDDVFVVWFSKTLQNWKALVGTTIPGESAYFELTYDGDKKQTYIDLYEKLSNEVYPDVSS